MSLTPTDFWTAVAVIAGAALFLSVGYCLHLRSIVNDIIRDEKSRLREWAHRYAEQLAQEYVRRIHIDVPVSLVNESDIDWGKEDTQ